MSLAAWLDGNMTFLTSLGSDSRRDAAIKHLAVEKPKHAAILRQTWEKKHGPLKLAAWEKQK